MKAAVVGAGDISQVHLTALASLGVEVRAVADPDRDRAARAAEPFGAVAVADVEQALELGVDVVHVCTPHDQHLPVVERALTAGAHVLTEKPLAHTLADAERLARLAEEATTTVGVCLQNRYNPTSRAMRQALDSGDLGAVVSVTATVAWSRTEAYYAAKPWAGMTVRSGGGALINQAIHTVDLLQWLLGPASDVVGQAYRLLPVDGVDVEDTATATMLHDRGNGHPPTRSTIWASNANAVNQPVTIAVVAERGSLSLDGDLTITDADGGTTVVSDTPPSSGAPAYWGASHEALIRDFYAGLDDPGTFWIDPAAALASQRILAAVYEQSGRTH